MTASVRILTTSSVDSSPSILLIAPDGSRTLVNCGEGCQRSFIENSQRLSKVKTICLTHIGHDSIGGLPGSILTTSDAAAAAAASQILAAEAKTKNNNNNNNGAALSIAESSFPSLSTTPNEGSTKQKLANNSTTSKRAAPDQQDDHEGLDLLGPAGTRDFLHSLRHFMRREKFPVRVHEGKTTSHRCFGQQRTHNPAGGGKKKKGDGDVPFHFIVESIPFTETVQSTCRSDKKRPRLERAQSDSSMKRERQILSFCFTTPPVLGKFLPEKATELGVPKGPLFGQLKNGRSVTFVDNDGVQKTVESHQVVNPPCPGAGVFVLYYPTCEVGKQVFASNRFQSIIDSNDVTVDLVLHITAESVFTQLTSLHWKRDVGSDSQIQHVLLSSEGSALDVDGTPFRSAALGAISRSLLCNNIYPPPHHWAPMTDTNVPVFDGDHIRLGRSFMEYGLIPRSRKGFLDTLETTTQALEQEMRNLVEQSGAESFAARLLKDCSFVNANTSTASEGELIFTGTGSAVPCKHRNVTGILLKGRDGRGILLDVGEGTVGQLKRTSPDYPLELIKVVWISHPHADHHLGIIRFLHERDPSEPLLLIAPTPLFRFLDEYCSLEPSIRGSYIPMDCSNLMRENPVFVDQIKQSLGFSVCQTVPVKHCNHAYAVILDGTPFGRVVYSGDCRPSYKLAQIAQGADLLIHEATFEDGMETEAALKKHSTVGEALRVAHDMQVKCVILTHFSQRYPRIPPTPAQEHELPIVFAFDYMRLTPCNLMAASKLTPALRLLYPDESSSADAGSDDNTGRSSTHAVAAMSVPGLFAHKELL